MGGLTTRVGKAYFADTPYLRLIKVQSGHSGRPENGVIGIKNVIFNF